VCNLLFETFCPERVVTPIQSRVYKPSIFCQYPHPPVHYNMSRQARNNHLLPPSRHMQPPAPTTPRTLFNPPPAYLHPVNNTPPNVEPPMFGASQVLYPMPPSANIVNPPFPNVQASPPGLFNGESAMHGAAQAPRADRSQHLSPPQGPQPVLPQQPAVDYAFINHVSNAIIWFRNYPTGPFTTQFLEMVTYLFGQARAKSTADPVTYFYQYRRFMSELAFHANHKLGMDISDYKDIV
jgi:hypothetical protein